MEYAFIIKIIDLLTDAMSHIIKRGKVKNKVKKSSMLISESMTELLSLNPNLYRVQAKLNEAEATIPFPSEQLLRAQGLLQDVKMSEKRKSLAKKKTAAKKKAAPTKKMAVKKKTSKKKAITGKKTAAKKKTTRKKATRR